MFIVDYFIFPGFLFTLILGGWGWWLERKLTARFQYRAGPPWYQNFLDIAKLFCKEQIIPEGANKPLFIISPLVSFGAVLLLSFIINASYLYTQGFAGDVIVILYLLIIPSLFIVLGGAASSNPLATAGASREIKLMLSYEFIFIVSLVIAIIKSKGLISLVGIIDYQREYGSHIFSISGIIGFILGVFYIQAKLGIVPFDVSEAEQEIMGGPFIEYCGPLLSFFKVTKALLYFILPVFIILLFAGKNLGWHLIYKYIIMVLIISVLKNTNPRLCIKDILGFFWFFLFPLGCIGIIFAIMGY